MFNFFNQYPNLACGISEKTDGNLKLGANNENLKNFLAKRALNEFKIFRADLAHSNRVVAVDNLKQGEIITACDGLVAKAKNALLTATFADCFPVYFYDSVGGAVGLAHCGWRGITKGLINKIILSMQNLGSRGENIVIGIGPGIQQHHFEIKDDIVNNFSNYPNSILKKDGKIFIDLPGIIKAQLALFGIIPTSIEDTQECTYCEKDKYFSFRRDKPKTTEAVLGYIGLK